MTTADSISVKRVDPADVHPWLLNKHYAKRLCPISHAFAAFEGEKMIGVVTYGCPSSSPLREGVCGPEWAGHVLELNRLCCESRKNLASIIVGNSLSKLPKPSIVVSYADTNQGHVGYVYQATNFLYTGLSAKRTDWKVKGMEHLHGQTIADMSKGHENRADFMREKFGDDFYLEDRPRKHRYIYIVASKTKKKLILSALKYPVDVYPKGKSKRYDATEGHTDQTYFNI
jgi:hypothetical protein